MTTDTALIEKREELKRRLAAGEYKTLVDKFLDRTDRILRRMTRSPKPLPLWYIVAILSLTIIFFSFLSAVASGAWIVFRSLIESRGLGSTLGILGFILPGILALASPIAINHYIGRVVALWQDSVLEATESIVSLNEFENWLKKICNWQLHFLITIIGGILGGLYLTAIVSTQIHMFVGYGLASINIVLSMFSTAFVYLLLGVVLLSAILRRYELRLFAADPSSSELVSRLSSELSFVVYFFAVYAAIITFLFTWSGFLPSFVIIIMPGLWLPIIVLFILDQTSLSSIIRRAKWKTLNEIQTKVEKLQATENFAEKETIDSINRLLDYHDRVKATRNSAVNLGTALNFINSLLLPLIAFILGNLDLVLKLFARKP